MRCKKIQMFFILIICLACKNQTEQAKNKLNQVDSITQKKENTVASRNMVYVPEDIDSSLLQFDTAIIQGNYFEFHRRTNNELYIINRKHDTVLAFVAERGIEKETLFDFNKDGSKDLVLVYSTHAAGVTAVFLFNAKRNNFIRVENLEYFPDPQPLNDTKYFYSYRENGCADSNWASDLFYLENHKAVRIGNIDGVGCGTEEVKSAIYISSVKSGKLNPVATYSIDAINNSQEDKWEFIENYWTKNYKRFID